MKRVVSVTYDKYLLSTPSYPQKVVPYSLRGEYGRNTGVAVLRGRAGGRLINCTCTSHVLGFSGKWATLKYYAGPAHRNLTSQRSFNSYITPLLLHQRCFGYQSSQRHEYTSCGHRQSVCRSRSFLGRAWPRPLSCDRVYLVRWEECFFNIGNGLFDRAW